MRKMKGLKHIVFLFVTVFGLSFTHVNAQGKTDRTVATVKLKDRNILTSIKHSDVMFQLAITPGISIEPPTSNDFDRALQFVIEQRLIHLSDIGARPTEAEIREQLIRILARFPTSDFLNKRVRILGFESIQDYDSMRRIEQIAWIEKYLNSRFHSNVVITTKEEEEYYQNVFMPEFRRRNSEAIVPELDKQRLQIRGILTEAKTVKAIENFLCDLKQKAEIIILEQSKPANSNIQSLKKD